MIILNEAGFKNLCVDINSVGDKECRPSYIKALVAHYRRYINVICADCRQRVKTNPLRVLDCKNEKCQQVKDAAPDVIGALCVSCRQHFKEVLEYLETLGVPYRINDHLVRGLDYYTKTAFEIFDDGDKSGEDVEAAESGVAPLALAGGGRYDYLAKALGGKRDVPSVGGSIGVDRVLGSPAHKILSPRMVKKPKVYFIQIGFEAKLKSLGIIEILRKAHVPVMHSLSKDSLAGQLSVAERLDIPYTIIFGQKEALDGSVIIRDMQTRSQETVAVGKLPEYLKNLK